MYSQLKKLREVLTLCIFAGKDELIRPWQPQKVFEIIVVPQRLPLIKRSASPHLQVLALLKSGDGVAIDKRHHSLSLPCSGHFSIESEPKYLHRVRQYIETVRSELNNASLDRS